MNHVRERENEALDELDAIEESRQYALSLEYGLPYWQLEDQPNDLQADAEANHHHPTQGETP